MIPGHSIATNHMASTSCRLNLPRLGQSLLFQAVIIKHIVYSQTPEEHFQLQLLESGGLRRPPRRRLEVDRRTVTGGLTY